MLERSEIAALIPHSGSMCLVDRVLSWGDDMIRCSSDSHHRSDHPLRRNGRLGAVHLVEYAVQAMAIHGALLARQRGESLTGGIPRRDAPCPVGGGMAGRHHRQS